MVRGMAKPAELLVYGIPTCGTVKKARAWLDARGVAHRFVDMRADPPARAVVASWQRAFGSQALKNTSGGSYRALPADKDAWDDAVWLGRFAADPMLIKRPVIAAGDRPLLVGFRGDDDAIAAALVV
jgi:arsenate reductase